MDLETMLAEVAVGHPRPLSIGRIMRELDALERELGIEAGVQFRLTTTNLVVVCSGPDQVRGLGLLLGELCAEFPCRCLVAILDPEAEKGTLQGWASLTCHPHRRQHMCCEQVILYCPGGQGESVPSLVSATLLPEVPTLSWWRGEPSFGSHLLEQVLELSDRVVFDSADFPVSRMEAVQALVMDRYHQEQAFSDLSWGRLEEWREEIASLFDPPEAIECLSALAQVEIRFVPGPDPVPPQPLLLAGWLASRLGWRPAPLSWTGDAFVAHFSGGSGRGELRLVPVWAEGLAGQTCAFSARTRQGREFRVDQVRPRRRGGREAWKNGLDPEVARRLEQMGRELSTLSRDVVYQEALESALEVAFQAPEPRLQVVADLAEAAADHIEARLREQEGPFRIALAGGRTPRRLYAILAGRDLPWERLRVFLGDERVVPEDHPDSNYRMVRETLLEGSPLQPDHVFRWETERGPEEAARAYAQALDREFAGAPPCFDLVLLGLGEDGHTASLFPGTPALQVFDQPTAANPLGEGKGWRLTLTMPVLNLARRAVFLVGGRAKSAILRRVLAREPFPASRVRGREGTLFLADREAAPEGP